MKSLSVNLFSLGIVIVLFSFVFPTFFHASAFVNSAVVCTKVGNPNTPLPTQCPVSGSNNDLVKAGQAIKDAFVACESGRTFAGSDACINASLAAAGYAPDQIAAFDRRRPSTVVFEPRAGDCTQCVGFVSLSLALISKDSSALTGFGTAANIANVGSFKAGSTTYQQVSSTGIQPGDIAIADATAGFGSAGHILIVKEVQGNVKFIALESNWTACTATDNISHVNGQEKNGSDIWNFYRAK